MITSEHGETIEIHPTGTCFDDAIELISRWIKGNEHAEDWHHTLKLAHGILKHENGHDYAHAWVERIDRDRVHVWQSGLYKGQRIEYAVDRREFYEELKARDVTLYSLREMALENLRSGHYGPWQDRYDRLCKTPRAARAIFNRGKKG